MNLYGFADGDPVNFSDPFGLCPDPNDPACQFAIGGGRAPGAGLGALLATIGQRVESFVESRVAMLKSPEAWADLAIGIIGSIGGEAPGGLTPGQAGAIQAFASKYNVEVTLVGGRAAGKTTGDFDYLMSGNAKLRKAALRELPRGTEGGEIGPGGRPRGIDIFMPNRGDPALDPNKPHIIFRPKP